MLQFYISVLFFLMLTHVTPSFEQFQPTTTVLYCPPIVIGEEYTVTAEWYRLNSSSNLINATIIFNKATAIICYAQNMSCVFQGFFQWAASIIKINYQFLADGNDFQAQIVVPSNRVALIGGESKIIWGTDDDLVTGGCNITNGSLVNECTAMNTCKNGATCLDRNVGFYCSCPPQFSGYVCDHGGSPYCYLSSVQPSSASISKIGSNVTLNFTCQTFNYSSVMLANYSGLPGNIFSLTTVQNNNYYISIVVTLLDLQPGLYNLTLTMRIAKRNLTNEQQIYVYDPEIFSSQNLKAVVYQDWSIGNVVTKVNTSSSGQLFYTLKNGKSNDNVTTYFQINMTGFIQISRIIPDTILGTVKLLVEVMDIRAMQKATATLTLYILKPNTPVTCSAAPNIDTISITTLLPVNVSSISCSYINSSLDSSDLNFKLLDVLPSMSFRITPAGNVMLTNIWSYKPTQLKMRASIEYANLTTVINIMDEKVFTCSEALDINTIMPCPEFYDGNITLHCLNNGSWGYFTFNNCTWHGLKKIFNQVSAASNFSDVSEFIKNITLDLNKTVSIIPNILSGDIKYIILISNRVGNIVKQNNVSVNYSLLSVYIDLTNTVLKTDVNKWTDLNTEETEFGSLLVNAIDVISKSTLTQANDNYWLVKENIVVKCLRQNKTSWSDIIFPDPNDKYPTDLNWDVAWRNTLFLSKYAFPEPTSYCAVAYKSTKERFIIKKSLQEKYNQIKNASYSSDILTLSIGNNITKINRDLVLNFTLVNKTETGSSNCAFLNVSFSELGVWSTYGCKEDSVGNDRVICSCNHLTNFAILLSTTELAPKLELSIISIVGCSVSIVCLTMTLIVYALVWKSVKKKHFYKLNINLSVCLILCYVLFLAAVDKTENQIWCKVIACLLHYLFLVVFFTMLSEGVQLYKSINLSGVLIGTSIVKFLFIFIYGCPLIIVAVTLGITKTENYVAKDFCWLSLNDGVIWSFLGPVIGVLFINYIIMIFIICKIQTRLSTKQKYVSTKQKSVSKRVWSSLWTIFSLSPILGATWIFGVLSVNSDHSVFQYLFAITNSLQGALVFICYCCCMPDIQKALKNLYKKHITNRVILPAAKKKKTTYSSGPLPGSHSFSTPERNEITNQESACKDSGLNEEILTSTKNNCTLIAVQYNAALDGNNANDHVHTYTNMADINITGLEHKYRETDKEINNDLQQ